MKNIYEVARENKIKSAIVIIGFLVFVTLAIYFISQAIGIYAGYEPGGLGMVGIALIISGLMSIGGYYFSDRIVLSISGARPADRRKEFNFYTVAENLSIASGIPKPKLYVIEDSAPNAFATGRDPEHAVVCATTGILRKLDRTELEGVIAHELTHVKNYDTRLMSVVAVLVGCVALLADWFFRMTWYGRRRDSEGKSGQLAAVIMIIGVVFAILSPIIAQLIQLAISRRREFMADAGSVELTRQPAGLISALKKISEDHETLEAANKATAHLYIVNPFKEKVESAVGWFAGLFNTHPPMTERIKLLEQMT
ncbi:zinc metalloprotease HtpX [Candidatus Woesebacteria bacterium RIFCSPLOWO2_01_FULL_39_61]|uniref:Protease HtpX homolog n=1 Tax=Candidatus Woesebacteria bacterium RIFCSPHIGHO2_02_FULL_39_13 TaxID=1802505 RepID=A0A1F7YY80_9BACT|nr:MAG: zinc metalloprotease HtpX [Candidatus Woesebacteria bacterium RIFCSPHIGHO2_01_FULL_39_95]OGM32292.1 MAG: zinc metalloprotease HtpX [Candidatus Woesebacteria bacterium RIFCSPHIGHO2_02_FULL_39_13]OGM37060.1 MAG: zinc metalloprotease HtpX [Candidatus Woesebacteria bacterium RIFCSPHIGHO2_12_FULL_40_20]OGM65444.1 MAG: zinc metalloprotease HtpX [Candidatus Woesebacteria bacterium RIFCSPLOWO2_01_FULL_39_61]OGM75191.1 MAG: zinc metalloprotease HtpX [Candidatus Woesebacteria bacterium RIFCSPLOWO